jgi:tight adherence protein C
MDLSLQAQAILIAAAGGIGIALLIAYMTPHQPSLKDALGRLSGTDRAATDVGLRQEEIAKTQLEKVTLNVGRRLYPVVTEQRWLHIPVTDLAILRRSVPRFLGDKVLSAGIGLFFPPLMNFVLVAADSGLDWQLPAFAGLAMGAILFFAPDIEVRRRAAAARTEFRRALGAFVELAALCRNAGIGVTQSLELAANVADTWVFARLGSALQEAAYAGRNAWTALEVVAHELDIPDLADVADIMELSGNHGTSVYATLRAQAAGLRNSMMADDQGDSRSATTKMNAPLAGIAVLFFILLLIPALSNIVAS